jgi:deoxyribonuclease-4
MDDRASGIQRNADAITEALERVAGRTVLCMESTAGAGTVIGSTFEELAKLLELVPAAQRKRMGVCVDTCHAYSAGYDLVRDFDGVWQRFDDVVGARRLKVLHLNDSKMPFGSHRDRHELIGEGTLGPDPSSGSCATHDLPASPKSWKHPSWTTPRRPIAGCSSACAGTPPGAEGWPAAHRPPPPHLAPTVNTR